MPRWDGSPDKNAGVMSAPHNLHRLAAQRERIRCFVSLRKVGESVWIFPSSGSCQPTRTDLAFGDFLRSSGPLFVFPIKTHLARIIRSTGMPFYLHRDVTLFSIQEFHSFFMACSKSCWSSLGSFLKDTSTLRNFDLGVT